MLNAKLLGLTLATAMGTACWAQGPAVATRYTEPGRIKDVQLTQETCLARAEVAYKALDFTNIERTEQSRYATFREYTGSIRCVLDKQIIIFVVAGPDRETANRGAAALFERFEAGK